MTFARKFRLRKDRRNDPPAAKLASSSTPCWFLYWWRLPANSAYGRTAETILPPPSLQAHHSR